MSLEDDNQEERPAVHQTQMDDVKAAVNGDRRLTASELADEIGLTYGRVERILPQGLNMRKMSARLVPRFL